MSSSPLMIARCLLLQQFCISALVPTVALEQPVVQGKYTSRGQAMLPPVTSIICTSRNTATPNQCTVDLLLIRYTHSTACWVALKLLRMMLYNDVARRVVMSLHRLLNRHSQGYECTTTGTEACTGTNSHKHRCIHTDVTAAHVCAHKPHHADIHIPAKKAHGRAIQETL